VSKRKTYAQIWAKAINETYDVDARSMDADDEEIRRVLLKAAECLRGYTATVTLTGAELDLVRLLMPAHEVHQSISVRWVHDTYPMPEGREQ
jgi:hypothetical protein